MVPHYLKFLLLITGLLLTLNAHAGAVHGHPDAINALIDVYSGKLVGFKADPAKE